MYRYILTIAACSIAGFVWAQKGRSKLETASDAWGMIHFNPSTLTLSEAGHTQLKKLCQWFNAGNNAATHHLGFHGAYSDDEVQADPLIGYKRCRVIVDSLIRSGVDARVLYIVFGQFSSQESGVGFIIGKTYKSLMIRKNGKTIGSKEVNIKQPDRKKGKSFSFSFEVNSVQLSADGRKQVLTFISWLKNADRASKYALHLYGSATETEEDYFIDIKRCLALADILTKAMDDVRIFIRFAPTDHHTGNAVIRLFKSKIFPKGKEEDKYFKEI